MHSDVAGQSVTTPHRKNLRTPLADRQYQPETAEYTAASLAPLLAGECAETSARNRFRRQSLVGGRRFGEAPVRGVGVQRERSSEDGEAVEKGKLSCPNCTLL